MKNTILVKLLFLFLVFISFSCKKDSNSTSSDSYVKFKMNGEWITYKGLGELGPDLGDNTKIDLGVTGNSDDSKTVFDISIQLDGNNFPTGTYFSDKYPDYYIIVDLLKNPDPSTAKYYDITDALNQDPSKYIVNITSITPTQIQGTFTGNYLYSTSYNTDPDGGIVYITEGEFKVKRIR